MSVTEERIYREYGMRPERLPWFDTEDRLPPSGARVYVLGWHRDEQMEDAHYGIDTYLKVSGWSYGGVLQWAWMTQEQADADRYQPPDPLERLLVDAAEAELYSG